ncbi:UNVERIFIED_ORG: hypothetical protein GGI61_002496 [Rhizobium esperanzae]
MTKSKEKSHRRHCGHALWLRVQRARRVHRELSAQGAAAQLLAVVAALVGSMPLPSPRASSGVSVSPPATQPRVMMFRPPPTLDETMRHIRGARQMTPRVRVALDALKVAAPLAADWIDDRARWLEWSDLTRCLVAGDEDATLARLQHAAAAWRLAKEPPQPKKGRRPKKGQNADGIAFKP